MSVMLMCLYRNQDRGDWKKKKVTRRYEESQFLTHGVIYKICSD